MNSAHDWRWKIGDALAVIVLVALCFYYLTGFRFDTLFSELAREVDFKQWYRFPPMVLQHLKYPSLITGEWTIPFPYLPSAIALFLSLSVFPEPAAFAFWMVLQATSLGIVLFVSLRLTGAWQRPGCFLLALGAVLMTENAIAWDFRTHNNNLVYLALVMLALLASRTWLAGLLLGISCNLKIYSGLLALGLLWRREYRLVIVMIVWSAVIAVVLPVIVFGPSAFLSLLVGWFDQAFHFDPPPGVPSITAPNLMAISAAALLGVAPGASATIVLLRAMQAIWLAVLAGYIVAAGQLKPAEDADPSARLSDMIVFLLAPLPFSHWFQSYHAVVNLPAFVLLIMAALDIKAQRSVRIAVTVMLAATQAVYFLFQSYEWRGAVYFVMFVLLTVALGLVRRSRRLSSAAGPAKQY